jgi:hypothetical protein
MEIGKEQFSYEYIQDIKVGIVKASELIAALQQINGEARLVAIYEPTSKFTYSLKFRQEDAS